MSERLGGANDRLTPKQTCEACGEVINGQYAGKPGEAGFYHTDCIDPGNPPALKTDLEPCWCCSVPFHRRYE